MLERVGARVVCTEGPTNWPGTGKPARLDCFIVSPELRHAMCDIRLITEFGWEEGAVSRAMAAKTHALVAIKVMARAIDRHMDSIRMPRKFERKKPVGCARAPVVPSRDDVPEGETQGEMARAGEGGEWKEILRCVEAELC